MLRNTLALAMTAFLGGSVVAQDLGASQGSSSSRNDFVSVPAAPVIRKLSPAVVEQAWRSRQLVGQEVRTTQGVRLGVARELIIDMDGRISGVMIEAGESAQAPETVRYLPWNAIHLNPDREGVIVHLPDVDSDPADPLLSRTEFRSSELIGDAARLQTGYRYGFVTDILFRRNGRTLGVVVTRDAALGGGAYAFPIGELDGRWRPGLSYFGLPYVQPRQADDGGVRMSR